MELYEIDKSYMNTVKGILYLSDKCYYLTYTSKLNMMLFLAQGSYYKHYKKYLYKDEFMLDYAGPKIVELKEKYLTVLALNSIINLNETSYGETVAPNTTIYNREYSNREKTIYNKLILRYSKSTGYDILQDLEYLYDIFKVKEKVNFEKCLDYFD